ncbi:MAG: RES domain-containing protein [Candidatus Latescibacterota bacterium]
MSTVAAWRIVKAARATDAFSGDGARRAGGRWNHPGTPIMYTAGSLALAALDRHGPGRVARLRGARGAQCRGAG